MSSTEPDPRFEHGLIAMQHIGGVITFAFNVFIVILIRCDYDIRNRGYRKYLCSMQIASLVFDSLFDLYSPIILIHKGLFYSDSLLATVVNVETFSVIESVLLAEVLFTYFICVYYRRCVVMGPECHFMFRGKRRIIFYTFLQLYVLSAVAAMHFFRSLPPDIEWARNRTTFMHFRHDVNMQYAAYCTFPASSILNAAIIGMLWQLVREVKSVRKTSFATQRYQRLAGTVPSLVYIIPSCTNTILQFAPTVMECGEKFDLFASVLSPIVWLIMAKHTFMSSLTILYCSPSYRERIIALAKGSNKTCSIVPQPLSESSRGTARTA